jgi:hypothetical protein
MTPEIFLTVGVLLLLPTIPMIFNGLKEGAAPKFAMLMTLISFGLIAVAFSQKPGGYNINEIPGIMISTIKGIM